MLAGNLHPLILISFTVFVVLFAIQATTGNPRFLYLYPVNTKTGDPSSGLDTGILRWMILIGVFFFFFGATKSLLGAVLVFLVGGGFPVIWKNTLSKVNDRRLKRSSPNLQPTHEKAPPLKAPFDPRNETLPPRDFKYDLASSSAAISVTSGPDVGADRSEDDGEDHD